MKTLIIYNTLEIQIQFLIVDGDYSRFDGIKVNLGNKHEFEEEFIDFIYDKETGELNHDSWSTDKSVIESKNWDKVAVCTWLP